MLKRKCRAVTGSPIKIDPSYTGKIIVTGDNDSFPINFHSEVVCITMSNIITGELEGVSPDGWMLIIEGMEVPIGKNLYSIGILD